MQQWEYRVLKIEPKGWFGGKVNTDSLATTLNELGREGWEVTTAIDTNSVDGSSREVNIILKRLKR